MREYALCKCRHLDSAAPVAGSDPPAEFRLYERLFTDANPAAAETVDEFLNPNSLVVAHGLVEANLINAEAEKAYQFERMGYFCADNKDSSTDHLVFNRTVGLRDTWAKIGD